MMRTEGTTVRVHRETFMADLQALCDALQSHADRGECAKVSFYYVGADGVALRHGALLLDRTPHVSIDHQGMATEDAIRAIAGLKLVKIASLVFDSVQHAASEPIALPVLLQTLRSAATAPAPRATTPEAAPAPAAPAPAVPASPAPAAPHVTAEQVAASSIDLKGEARRLLEPLFGMSAGNKIDEFSIAHPPQQHPYEFVLQCQRHAAIMLGAPKAEAMFRPLYDQLDTERLHRRR